MRKSHNNSTSHYLGSVIKKLSDGTEVPEQIFMDAKRIFNGRINNRIN